MTFSLRLRDNSIKVFNKPCVMGIINTSPNSFYQPFSTISAVLFAVEKMQAMGADFVDVGGEATNPQIHLENNKPSLQEEIDRTAPFIAAIAQHFPILISVDTSRAEVMRAALNAGAHLINDQRALQDEAALQLVKEFSVPVCLMHFGAGKKSESSDMPAFFQQIKQDLHRAVQRCTEQGIDRDRIIIDPGFGQGNYGKNCQENFYLLSRLAELTEIGLPVLVGWSRKSMIGDVLGGVAVEQRLFGSVAAATIAAMQGAAIIRVHDVKETVDAMKIVQATQGVC